MEEQENSMSNFIQNKQNINKMDYQYEYIKLKSQFKKTSRRQEIRIQSLKKEIHKLKMRIINPYKPHYYNKDLNDLMDIISKVTFVTKEDIIGRVRKQEFVLPRALFCYVANVHLKKTKSEIARYINRDHTSVIYFIKRYQDYIDMEYQPELEYYEETITQVENEVRED